MGFFKKILTGGGTFLDPADVWGDTAAAQQDIANKQYADALKQSELARQQAADQAAATAAQQKQYQDALIAMSTNSQKLADANNAGANTANISNVIAGGSAGAVSTLRKKKDQTLSSSLGINI
jgi:23S rRNA pseudoU1915 N3-methylase RlmH